MSFNLFCLLGIIFIVSNRFFLFLFLSDSSRRKYMKENSSSCTLNEMFNLHSNVNKKNHVEIFQVGVRMNSNVDSIFTLIVMIKMHR
jgi:hypothetical protein